MRHCKTIFDLKELLADYGVQPRQQGDSIVLLMPPTDDWLPDQNADEMPLIGDGSFDEPSGVNFARQSRNVIRELVGSPQFWRATTVANQVANFWLSLPDEGSSMGFIRLRKKTEEPLTMLFTCEEMAKGFMGQLR